MFFGALGSLSLGTAPVERVPIPQPPSGGGESGGGIFNTHYRPPKKERPNYDALAVILAAYQEYYND